MHDPPFLLAVSRNSSCVNSPGLRFSQALPFILHGRKRLLLLPILCLMPAAANAESVWLLVSRTRTGMEKIEMRDMDQCNEVRAHWEKRLA